MARRIVEEVGRLVKRVKVGDQVMLATTRTAACAGTASPAAAISATRGCRRSPMPPCRQHAGLYDARRSAPPGTRSSSSRTRIGSCDLHEGTGGRSVGPRVRRGNRSRPGHVPLSDRSGSGCRHLRPRSDWHQRRARRAHSGCEDDHRIDPIKYRRDLAMKLGATDVLDPNATGATI